MKKLLYIPVFVLACIIYACSENKVQTDESAYDSSAFHIAVLRTEECHAFMYADSCGLFDSLGVNVVIVPFESEMDADTAFIKGWAQMEITDSVRMSYIQTLCTSDSIISVMSGDLKLSLIMSAKSRVRKISSLKEKIVAITRNSALDKFADKITEKAGLKHEELNRPQINNIRMRAQMLMRAQYDGAILPEPWATQCVDSGAILVTTTDEIYPMRFQLIVNDSIFNCQKDNINKILTAYKIATTRINK